VTEKEKERTDIKRKELYCYLFRNKLSNSKSKEAYLWSVPVTQQITWKVC
jgi:hypothetical protein